ncbi:MAG TPA: ACP S-malonyltransferase [Archangium sp.]|uniref:ACP S-malonyltransferase n=1 Tax=Archangium sp. TaxID=1872627 RepID=UPI002E33730E|nr:ACP S-malonyltransferase [Archangium sp.]HEX5748117.1 ACP S-malonyltransferase [Archangium sp.]
MAVFMFPGQGAQTRGMAGELFSRYPEYTAAADEILGYSVEELCKTDPKGLLQQTEYTQPALFVVNVLFYIEEIVRRRQYPRAVIGHSLGEYNALFAAGAFDFRTGVQLVKKRGELMSQQRGGGMAAVLGLDSASVRTAIQDAGLDAIDLANDNAPRQVVISGPKSEIDRAQPIVEARGARFVPLRVSGAFHSRYMKPVQQEFSRALESARIGECRLDVVANVDAKPYHPGSVRANLLEQLVRPVLFTDSVRHLIARGETEFVEVGPGKVLTGLVGQVRGIN